MTIIKTIVRFVAEVIFMSAVIVVANLISNFWFLPLVTMGL